METLIVEKVNQNNKYYKMDCRISQREKSENDWINDQGSGTLRKNKKLGMAYKSQYLEERIAYEFGWEFECHPRSKVMFGDAFTEGDSSAVTETGWHIERYITLSVFTEEYCEFKKEDYDNPLFDEKLLFLNIIYSKIENRTKEILGII